MELQYYEQYLETKVHAGAEFPYTTYLCSIPRSFVHVPLHWHEEIEVIIIKKGICTVHLDMKEYLMREGDILLILPGQIHGIDQYQFEKAEYENILFKEEFVLAEKTGILYDYLVPLFRLKRKIPCIYRKELSYYDSLYHCIKKVDDMSDRRGEFYELRLKSLWLEFFYYILSENRQQQKVEAPSFDLNRSKLILDYIHQNFGEAINPNTAAAHLNISSSHFMKLFKQQFGTSFIQYINEYRLNVSTRLLQTTTKSVTEIAMFCGFSSSTYYNRLFYKKYGLTPSQFRKE